MSPDYPASSIPGDPLMRGGERLRPSDVAIVGAGIAGTSTLLRLLEEHRGGAARLRVTVIERSCDLYAGLPYGARSGSASLIVTPLRDFLPEDMRARFVAWLEEWSEAVLAADPALGISCSWVREHEGEIRAGRWLDLFVPRRLFGRFLEGLVRTELARTPEVDVLTVRGEAVGIRQDAGADRTVVVRTPDGMEGRGGLVHVPARAVVLALGSPPKQALSHVSGPQGVGLLVGDTHTDSLDDLLVDLRHRLRSLPVGASRDVLVVGANADALELLHAVHRSELRAPWDRRVTVLAPHGTPDAWSVRPDRSAEYRSLHLADWARATADADLTACGIYERIQQDVAAAIAAGFAEQDTVPELKRLAAELLDRLPAAEQRAFVCTYGNLINRFYRPTGGDYQQVASTLLDGGRLDVVGASFAHAEAGPTGWTVSVRAPGDGPTQLEGSYGVIVNCTGFQTLKTTADPMLRALLDEGVVTATPSGRGLAVDDRFRAAPGIFVARPLLAGNLNGRLRVWRLESCRRVLEMSPDVVAEVCADLRQTVLAPA